MVGRGTVQSQRRHKNARSRTIASPHDQVSDPIARHTQGSVYIGEGHLPVVDRCIPIRCNQHFKHLGSDHQISLPRPGRCAHVAIGCDIKGSRKDIHGPIPWTNVQVPVDGAAAEIHDGSVSGNPRQGISQRVAIVGRPCLHIHDGPIVIELIVGGGDQSGPIGQRNRSDIRAIVGRLTHVERRATTPVDDQGPGRSINIIVDRQSATIGQCPRLIGIHRDVGSDRDRRTRQTQIHPAAIDRQAIARNGQRGRQAGIDRETVNGAIGTQGR